MRFDRRISPKFEALILENHVLRRFLGSPGAKARGPGLSLVSLDAQLRLGDMVSIYAGTTKVLDLGLTPGEKLQAKAHRTYAEQVDEHVFGTFDLRALPERLDAWSSYAATVKVGESWLKEGLWQAWLARRGFLGLHAPWAILDREAQPEGVDARMQRFLADSRRPWQEAAAKELPRRRNKLQGEDSGQSPDFIAVLPTGDLAIVEVKYGDAASGIYYAPLQVAGYVALWQEFLKTTPGAIEDLNAMIDQRKRLGLLAPDFPSVRSSPECVPVIFIGSPGPSRSSVWGSGGLLGTVINAARSAGAPLSNLQVWVASESDMKAKDITKSLRP